MLSCSIWFSAPNFGWVRAAACVVYTVRMVPCTARHHPHRIHDLLLSLLLLLLLLLSSSSSSSPLCRVFILIFLRQTMSLGNSVAAILLLLFMVLISLVSVLNLLYFYISTFRSMCAVPNMAVFWSSLTSCYPGMLLTYFLNDCEIVPVAPIITGITFVYYYY